MKIETKSLTKLKNRPHASPCRINCQHTFSVYKINCQHTCTHRHILLPSGFVGCIVVVKLKKGKEVGVLLLLFRGVDDVLELDTVLLSPPTTLPADDKIPLPPPAGEEREVGCCISVNWPSKIVNFTVYFFYIQDTSKI